MPQPRFLQDSAAAFDHSDVPFDFVFERFLQKPERVEVFDLDLGAEFFRPAKTHADVCIAAQRAFLHVAVAYSRVEQNLAQGRKVRVGLFRRAHMRFADDFTQRRAAAVVVHITLACGILKSFVQIFRRIFFKVQPRDADAFFCAADFDFNVASGGERKFVL